MKRLLLILLPALFLTTACKQSVGQLNNKGNKAFDAGDYAAAQEAYRSAQVTAPDVAEPYYNAANTYYRQKDYQQAELQAEQALRHANDPLAQNSFYNLGNTYYNNQQFDKAVAAYKQALRLNPNDADAKHNLELALQHLQKKQQDQQQNQQNQDNKKQNQQQNQNQQNQNTPTPTPQGSSARPTPQAGATPTPSNQGEQNQQNSQDQNSQQPQAGQPQPQKLTKEQARRLLEAIASNTKTLQEQLQQQFFAPGNPPAEDW